MATIFSRIINGEIPGTFVWRDERCVVFLSINPMAHGHALVVPIEEVDHWVDADPDLLAHLFEVTRVIGVAQERAFRCDRVGVIIAGYEVPHTHIHVIPTNSMSQLAFANAAASVDQSDLDAAAEAIRTELTAMGHPSRLTPSECLSSRRPHAGATRMLERRVDQLGALVANVVDVGADGPDLEQRVGSGEKQPRQRFDVVVLRVEPRRPRRLREDHRHAVVNR